MLAAFGADRDRFQTALEVQEFSGVAPVTERSGKAIWVHRRLACPKFMLQTFHEFANCAWRFCAWSQTVLSTAARERQGFITRPFVLWPTNGFASCSGAGRIARLTTTAST